jgi:hypothetical protein
MRHVRSLLGVPGVLGVLGALGAFGPLGCGEVHDNPDAAPPGDSTPPGDAPPDTRPDSAPLCTTYNGTWQTNAISFDTAIAPTARLDFETRADGVTGVVAGTAVPRDEYLACCGIRLDYLGPAGGRLIWAGNAQGGFSVRGICEPFPCSQMAGVRVTFVPAATAVGAVYPGSANITVFDAQNNAVSTMSVPGSGDNFLGYQAQVRLDHADFIDNSAEDLERLLYHRCQ